MKETKQPKPAGRRPKADEDRVKSKGVYLTQAEWDAVESKYGSGTQAIRKVVLPKIGKK